MGVSGLVLLLSCIVISLLHPPTSAQYCSYPGNFTSNSTYARNRDRILSLLPSAINDNHGFYNSTLGQGSDTVYALALCRGDLSNQSCSNCVNLCSLAIIANCPNKIEAIDFGNPSQCIVRTSNKSLFGVMDTRPGRIVYEETNITDHVNEFNQSLNNLVDRLVIRAAAGNSSLKFATGEKNYTRHKNNTVYGLMQCVPSISSVDCTRCLRASVDYNQKYYPRTRSVIILRPSCIFQHDLSPFLESSAGAEPPPPAPPVVVTFSPPRPSSNLTRNEGKGRSTVKQLVESGTNEDLPLFDFNTIVAATDNFSLENKLGQGGFGPVYKGRLPNGQEIAVKRLAKNSGQALERMEDREIKLQMYHGGHFEWEPHVSYKCGQVSFVPIDPDMLSYFELRDIYNELVGVQDKSNVDLYYRLPGFTLAEGLTKINDDNDVTKMRETYQGLTVMVIYGQKITEPLSALETELDINLSDIEIIFENGEGENGEGENGEVVQIGDGDEGLENRDEGLENGDEGLENDSEAEDSDYVMECEPTSDSDSNSESDDDSWLYEGLEGPDDDIFDINSHNRGHATVGASSSQPTPRQAAPVPSSGQRPLTQPPKLPTHGGKGKGVAGSASGSGQGMAVGVAGCGRGQGRGAVVGSGRGVGVAGTGRGVGVAGTGRGQGRGAGAGTGRGVGLAGTGRGQGGGVGVAGGGRGRGRGATASLSQVLENIRARKRGQVE
ncbi:hypothetical protein RHMOL_Rhmol07G0253400 [Rhododendron molle]|uniref:Uncharacterized protein n=1 Tax=Rhododendron molle TaxID=49168 RepID=A0ACC0N506_RHOML|nr:hypothetical protein RHMOL_Rhmol07G0253400 [Rhododendron molle]